MRAALIGAALLSVVLGDSAFAACSDDLVSTAQTLERSRTEVEGAASGAPAAKCAAIRKHVASLNQVKAVFARCDTGADKAKNAGQVTAQITAFTKQMRETCKN